MSGDSEAFGGRRWRLSTFELLLLGSFAALVVVANAALKLPIKMPGHSGIVWMALLVVGRTVVRKPGAGIVLGVFSGLLAALLGTGDRGALVTLLGYGAAGAGVDAVLTLGGGRENAVVCAVAGVTGNLAKLGVKIVLELAIGVPAGFVVLGRSYAALSHVVFGLAGGLLGFLAVRSLRRAGYFAYLAEKR
jgi:hypothetical protein